MLLTDHGPKERGDLPLDEVVQRAQVREIETIVRCYRECTNLLQPLPDILLPTSITPPFSTSTPSTQKNMDPEWCLNVYIPSKLSPLDPSCLPLPVQYIPDEVQSLKECAEHQIRTLMTRSTAAIDGEAENPPSYDSDDEDAMDDGFMICDLNVVRQKLVVWRRLFPRVKPFFALKCNPDPMVAAALLGGPATQQTQATVQDGHIVDTNDECSDDSLPAVCPAGFDCASVPEIQLALQCQPSSPSNIVYANPQRAEKDLETALLHHQVQVLTFDGPEELYKVHRILEKQQEQQSALQAPPTPRPQMVLRILVPDEHSSVPLGEKFGAAPAQIEPLAELAVRLALPIIGVSFHCGSGNHHPAAYADAIRRAAAAMQVINRVQQQSSEPSCWLLDMGGGYPGLEEVGNDFGRFCGAGRSKQRKDDQTLSSTTAESTETVADIAHAVTPLLDELFPQTKGREGEDGEIRQPPVVHIISEPGRYFVEAAFALCSRIYRVQDDDEPLSTENDQQNSAVATSGKETCINSVRQSRHYYIAQGVQGVFKDCVLCNESFTPIPLSLNQPRVSDEGDKDEQERLYPSIVHGPSGEDYDVICRDYPLPRLEIGDWLVFDRMGAYTLSIASRNGRPPVRYVMGGSPLSNE